MVVQQLFFVVVVVVVKMESLIVAFDIIKAALSNLY